MSFFHVFLPVAFTGYVKNIEINALKKEFMAEKP